MPCLRAFLGQFPPDSGRRARAIAEVCAAQGSTLPAAAIAFPHTHPSTINVTLGLRTADCGLRNRPDETWNSMISKSRTASGTISALRD
jgi:D-threo-aldose 1-dehydrogenase